VKRRASVSPSPTSPGWPWPISDRVAIGDLDRAAIGDLDRVAIGDLDGVDIADLDRMAIGVRVAVGANDAIVTVTVQSCIVVYDALNCWSITTLSTVGERPAARRGAVHRHCDPQCCATLDDHIGCAGKPSDSINILDHIFSQGMQCRHDGRKGLLVSEEPKGVVAAAREAAAPERGLKFEIVDLLGPLVREQLAHSRPERSWTRGGPEDAGAQADGGERWAARRDGGLPAVANMAAWRPRPGAARGRPRARCNICSAHRDVSAGRDSEGCNQSWPDREHARRRGIR
jgi:hypothetical protein